MTDTQINYFLTLASYKNITKTANHLGISQPTLSKQIASLEKFLRLSLFNRYQHGVELTSEGEIIKQVFSDFQNNLTASLSEVTKEKENNRSTLVIGYLEGWKVHNNITKAFKKMNHILPKCQILFHKFSHGELMKELNLDQIDVVFTLQTEEDKLLEYNSLVTSNHKISLVLNQKNSNNSSDYEWLKKQTFIIIGKKDYVTNPDIAIIKRVYGFVPSKLIYADSEESLLFYVSVGQGVALISDLSHIYGHSNLIFVPTNSNVNVVMFYKTHNSNPAIVQFAKLISNASSL